MLCGNPQAALTSTYGFGYHDYSTCHTAWHPWVRRPSKLRAHQSLRRCL